MAKLKLKQEKPIPNTSTKLNDKVNKKNLLKNAEHKVNQNINFKSKEKQNMVDKMNIKKKLIIENELNGEQAASLKKKLNLNVKNKNSLNLKNEIQNKKEKPISPVSKKVSKNALNDEQAFKLKKKLNENNKNNLQEEIQKKIEKFESSKATTEKNTKKIKRKDVQDQPTGKNVDIKEKFISKKVPKNEMNDEQASKLEKKSNAKNLKKENIKKEQNDLKSQMKDLAFDENKFNEIVNIKNAKKVAIELKKLVSEETQKSKKKQVFCDYKYMLNVTYFKIPTCPKRMVKLNLQHSLVAEDDDVVLFVKDLHRGSKVDFEPTIQHYEDLLREKGVTGIKTIMPFAQIKKEYNSYNAKVKLSNLFEHYICDGTIVGHLVGYLGKKFKKTCCTVYAVHMNAPDLAKAFEQVMKKTCFRQGEKGAIISIAVGNHTMSPAQVADNIITVVSQLKTLLPGGLPNIRNMYLKINIPGTSALPIYVSAQKPPSEVPNVIGPKEQKLRKLADEANKVLTKFHMSDDGKLIPLSGSEIAERKRKQKEMSHTEPKKMKNQIENLIKVVEEKNTGKKIKNENKNKKEEKVETEESESESEFEEQGSHSFNFNESESESDEDEEDTEEEGDDNENEDDEDSDDDEDDDDDDEDDESDE